MKLSDLLQTERKTYCTPGQGRYRRWVATFLGVAGLPCNTKPDAEKAVIDAVTKTVSHAYDNFYTWSKNGEVLFHLHYAGSWEYSIIHRDGQKSTCCFRAESFDAAKAVVLEHAENY